MNTIKIYLAESGRIADLRKDFPLYQGQYQNKLLNVFVPTSILAPNFSVQESGTTIADYVSSTAVKIGMQTTERNGKIYTSKTYYMRYLKTLTYQNVEYALYERMLPREFTFYSGQGLNAPNLIANVVNINNETTPATIFEITTSQTCSLDVMPSTYLDKDEPIEASDVEEINGRLNTIDEILTEKQNKTDNLLETTSKSVVGAINENKRRIDTNVAEINENSQDIAENRNAIDELREVVGTGQDFIGTMTVTSLPTTPQLNSFVQNQKGRNPKGGDTIIVVWQISDDTDKNYKYIYNGDEWTSYEIPPVEEAKNGTHGVIEGTYGIGLTYNTLVDISGGQIRNIYIKDNYGEYQPLHSYINMNSQDIADIINGDTVVGEAMKAVEDGIGNNIANTYLTQVLGATKQFVRDYAQPREFSNVYFISTTGYKTQAPTTPPSGIQFSTTTNAIGSFRIFQLEKINEASFELSSVNGYSNNLQISASGNCQVQFRLITEYQKDGGNWINLATELSNTISLISDDITKVQLSSQFLSIGDSVLMLDVGDKIRQTLEVVTQTSSTITFSLYSNDIFPSTFSITSQSYILSDIDQAKSQIIMIGADGVIESGNVVMTVQNAENYIEYRTNQREFLLDGNVPVVGEIPNTYPIRIAFGETVYNLYSFMEGGSSPLTFGDIVSSTTYNTNTGYDFNIRVMFIQTSDISGFVLSPSTITPKQIAKFVSNPNLVINGDFRVNQRSKSIYANSTYYTADGWQLGKNNDGYFDVSTKTLSCGTSGTYAILTQYVNVDIVALKGRQLTLSADIKGDGVNTVYLQFGFFTGSKFTQIAVNIIRNAPATMNRYVITGTIPDSVTSVNALAVRPYINAGSCVIDNIKLELGTVATPYNQRPYSEELAICQMPLVSGNQNLSTTYSNENILINGDFRVNQRNFTSTTDIGFTVDRWKNTRTNTLVTLNDDGTITLSSTPTQTQNTLITQKLEEKDYKNLLGGPITVSAMVSLDEGQTYNVYSITAVLPQTLPTTAINNETYFTDDTGVRHGSVRQYWTGAQFVVDIFGYNGYNVRVKWVKLEKGEIATPYNPRPYAEEFAMCQRYYQVVNVEGIAFTTFGQITVDGAQYYGANTLVSLPTTLRTKPTATITRMPYLRNYQSQNNIAEGYTEIIKFGNNIISLQFYNSSIPSGVIYYAHDGMAILDAEIY